MTTPNPVKFVKTQSAQPMGEYQPTAIDAKKEAAQLRLLQVAPKIIDSKATLKGRGIKPFGNIEGRYQVTDAAWVNLQSKYTWQTDF